MSKESLIEYKEWNILYGLMMVLFFGTMTMGILSLGFGDMLIGKVLITFSCIDIGLIFYVGHKRRHVRSDFNPEVVVNGDQNVAS